MGKLSGESSKIRSRIIKFTLLFSFGFALVIATLGSGKTEDSKSKSAEGEVSLKDLGVVSKTLDPDAEIYTLRDEQLDNPVIVKIENNRFLASVHGAPLPSSPVVHGYWSCREFLLNRNPSDLVEPGRAECPDVDIYYPAANSAQKKKNMHFGLGVMDRTGKLITWGN
jgi:hypothetical protein